MKGCRQKITFMLPPEAWHGHAVERLWSTEVSPNEYRIDNIPFFVMGVSNEDIVTANQGANGELVFCEVIRKGGHSTYRLMPRNAGESSSNTELLQYLRDHGCAFEFAREMLAIDVPPHADIRAIYTHLELGESQGEWSFEEADFARAGNVPPGQ